MKYKKFLESYGFSEVAITKLIKKGKCDTPYGLVEIKGNELITTLYATGEVKKEKME